MQETTLLQEEEARRYELAFLLIGEDSSLLRAALTKYGATITEERPLEKVHLAYAIGKQAYAFMGSIRFTATGELAALREDVKHTVKPLRFLIHRAETASARIGERSGERPRTGRPAMAAAPSSEGEPLTNEALEKKISEILQ